MAEKIFEVEYEPGKELVLRFHRPEGLTIIPKPSRGRLRQSSRDVLLGLRNFLDAALEAMGEKEGRKAPRTKIEVK